MAKEGFYILNYLDDHLIFGPKDKCQRGFSRLSNLFKELGLTINEKKNVTPNTNVICLGVMVDTKNFTASIPDEKLSDI